MKALILCGGSGTRLWPLSRHQYAKQFLKIGSNDSLLQKTAKRCLRAVAPADLVFVTSRRHQFLVESQLREVPGGEKAGLVLEPASRNTAPALALALRWLLDKGGAAKDEVVVLLPSDHLVHPEERFADYLRQAERHARDGRLVTFGIRPTKPETGYGYIRQGDRLDAGGGAEGFFRVERFVEKPDPARAEEFLRDGSYLWNSGMCAFRIDVMQAELARHAPAVANLAAGDFEATLAAFERMPNISLDYAVLEKSDKAGVLPLTLSWSDVGSWDSVYDVLDKDAEGNVKTGPIVDLGSKGNLFLGRKRLIATIGVENLLIVDTDDAILVAKRGEAQKVREIVEQVQARGSNLVEEHVTTHRPWGTYTVLEERDRYKIKRITVTPGSRLSLQLHYHRSEHWVVIKGTARVTVGDAERLVHENESIYVPQSTKHRLENPGRVTLEIIEVQVGEYVGEDDIVRFEDSYGR